MATPMPDWRAELDEGIRYQRGGTLDRALQKYRAVADAAPDAALVSEALRRQSDIFRMRSEWPDALAVARRSVGIAEAAGLTELAADALNTEASTHFYLGEFDVARPILERALSLGREPRVRGAVLQNLGAIAARTGDLETAERHFQESYLAYQSAGDARGEIIALQNYGGVLLDRENFDLACEVLRQAVTAARKVNDLDLLAMANVNYAEALAGTGEYTRATDCAGTALGYFTIVDNKLWRVKCLRLMGDLYVKQQQIETARRCYDRGAAIAEEIDARPDADRIAARLQALDGPS